MCGGPGFAVEACQSCLNMGNIYASTVDTSSCTNLDVGNCTETMVDGWCCTVDDCTSVYKHDAIRVITIVFSIIAILLGLGVIYFFIFREKKSVNKEAPSPHGNSNTSSNGTSSSNLTTGTGAGSTGIKSSTSSSELAPVRSKDMVLVHLPPTEALT